MSEWIAVTLVLMFTAFCGGVVLRPYFDRWWFTLRFGPWESYETMDDFIDSLEDNENV